jgi:hypothetical protein
MSRLYCLVAAVMLSALTIGSASFAAPTDEYRFTLRPASDGKVQASFHRTDRSKHNWSSTFAASDLTGLASSASGAPVRFALVREAGRMDCVGEGSKDRASGSCGFVPDAAFAAFLAEQGVRRPDSEEAFGMMALDVRRELVSALKAANFPTPDPDDLLALTALNVTPAYIQGLAREGYRPRTLDELTQFAALDISPDYIGGFVRAGYRDMKAEDLVQLKALGITADYVRSFEQLGYGRLPASELVQFKALGVTPEFVRTAQQGRARRLTVDELTELRVVGFISRSRP